MGDDTHWEAGKCLETLRGAVKPSEFGFRIQGLAAHILLRLGARVLQINTQGHPDIVAEIERGLMRIEVEADIHGSCAARLLTEEDLDAIAPRRITDRGYFALALCGPYPRWLLIEYSRLRRRRQTPASPAILQALSDVEASERWTAEFIALLLTHCRHLPAYSFDFLARQALEGKSL
jgi:hypothetical protein